MNFKRKYAHLAKVADFVAPFLYNKTLKQYIFRLINIFGQIYYPLKSQEGQNVGPKIIENQS